MSSVVVHCLVPMEIHVANNSILKRRGVSPVFREMLAGVRPRLVELFFFEICEGFLWTAQVQFIFFVTWNGIQWIKGFFAFASVFSEDDVHGQTGQHKKCEEDTQYNVEVAIRNMILT